MSFHLHGVVYDTGRLGMERFLHVLESDPRKAARRLEELVAAEGFGFDWSRVSWHVPPAPSSVVWIGERRIA